MNTTNTCNERHTTGCLIGTAIGDALGLPYEGMTAARAARILGTPDRFRFLLGRGMMSDDTEHTCMVAESLIESAFNVRQFEASFANRLRWWLLGAPAGTGLATLRACLRLVFRVPPNHSGVFSAGNGPAMRAAIIGSAIDEPVKLRQLVHSSTRITHTDPRAEAGALIVAAAARISTRAEIPTADALFQYLKELDFDFSDGAESLLELIKAATASVDRHETTSAFAASIGVPGFVTGFVNHTVPISIHAWLSYPEDWDQAVQTVIRCGGDADLRHTADDESWSAFRPIHSECRVDAGTGLANSIEACAAAARLCHTIPGECSPYFQYSRTRCVQKTGNRRVGSDV